MDTFDRYMLAFVLVIFAMVGVGLVVGFGIAAYNQPWQALAFVGGCALFALIIHIVAHFIKED